LIDELNCFEFANDFQPLVYRDR